MNLFWFKQVINDFNEKKNPIKILCELVFCMVKYREIPFFYFHKMLYRKINTNYLDYLSNKEWNALNKTRYLHKESYKDFFRNKLLFDRVFIEAKMPIPQLILYKIGNYAYDVTNEESVDVSNLKKFDEYLSNLIHDFEDIFIKTMDTKGGENCYLINMSNKNRILPIIYNQAVVLFQKKIVQHPELNKINPSSINTIRFDTYIDENESIVFLNALLRIGVGESVVDNASSGGFFVNVNIETGILNDNGNQFLKYGGKIYFEHPNTKFVFSGFKIPYFEESKELIKKAMSIIDEKLVGWDIAITPEGPIIVEGNHNLSLFMSDISIGGYKQNKTMRDILKKIN